MESTPDRPLGAPTPPLRGTRLTRFLGVAALVIALDQLTKALIRGRLDYGERWPEDWTLIQLTHVRNTGAAFGILQGASEFLVVAAFIAIGAMTVYLFTLPAHSRWYPVALSAILGGAVGNLIDRLRLGHVTDFIDPTHYPAFNLADSAIVLGVLAIAVLSFFDRDLEDDRPAEGDRDDERAHASREAST